MGMFDYIRASFKCKNPDCLEQLSDFQSKDGPCEFLTLDYWEVDNFYQNCPKCDTWNNYTLKQNKREYRPIDDYLSDEEY